MNNDWKEEEKEIEATESCLKVFAVIILFITIIGFFDSMQYFLRWFGLFIAVVLGVSTVYAIMDHAKFFKK